MNNHELLLAEKHRISAICTENGADYESRLQLASINAQLGDMNAVVECSRELIALKPDVPDVYYNLGFALHRLGMLDEACDSYNKTLLYDPAHINAHLNIGSIMRVYERFGEALLHFEKATELAPDQTEALFGCGICCMDLEKFSGAADYFSKYLKYKPDSCEAYCKLGIALASLDHIKEAMVAFERAVQINPKHAETWFHRNRIQYKRSQDYAWIQSGLSEDDTRQADKKGVQDSINKAINYFRAQKSIKPDYPYVYIYLQNKFGIDPLFSKEIIERVFRERKENKSSAKDNFILFYRLIDPEFSIPDHILERQSILPIDGATLQALYCDRWSSFNQDGFLSQIDSEINRKGYHLTHALIALSWIRENNCMDIDETSLIEQKAVIHCLNLLFNTKDFGDLAIEAVAILQYAGYHYLVKHEWIIAIIFAQQDDGGWCWDKTHEDTNTHTSVLALWSLLEYAAPGHTLEWIGSMP